MVSKLVTFSCLLLLLSWVIYRLNSNETPKVPDLDLEEWWGPGSKRDEDTSVRSFKINWESGMIDDLKERLTQRRPLTPPLEGIAFEYGFNSEALQEILKFWETQYNFSERLNYLNQYPQFKTKIQGLDVHFLWVKSKLPSTVKRVPLILLHGWPGSVREFYEAIPLLTAQRPGYDYVFELVVPSLVGFGYTDAAVRPGMGPVEQAVVMRNLMKRLGYSQYFVQGGDWGSVVGSNIATLFPDEVLGYHTNMPIGINKSFYKKFFLGAFLPGYLESALAAKVYPLSQYFSNQLEESGYFHIQATKPDTVGVGLTDSPAGLAAYILEKFSSGTNLANRNKKDGGLSQFRTEDLLDNLMIYWDSNCITSSVRLYAEYASARNQAYKISEVPTPVPTWAMHSPHEPLFFPATLMRYKYLNLIDVSLVEKGGHFAAFEYPKDYVEDVFRAVKAFQAYHLANKTKKQM